VSDIHVSSIAEPFDAQPEAALPALQLLFRAHSMGLWPEGLGRDVTLDRALVARLFRTGAERAGLWTELAARTRTNNSGWLTATCLVAAYDTLEASPYPPGEWRRARELLDDDQLAGLLGISASSLRRYADGRRPTPDETAARLHSLTRVLSALAGAYNRFGIRRWFDRPRSQLDGRTPGELFRASGGEDDPELARVVALAESLIGAGAAT
jgi:hypothetical protein